MINKEKAGWCISALLLIFLFLLSSTDLILKEREPEIYPISVILDDTNDEYYANFRKGVDMAAEKYHVDVNFITLYGENSGAEQEELFRREVRDGARAVILAPVDESSKVSVLNQAAEGYPVVLLGTLAFGGSSVYSVAPDMYAMGKNLGEQVVQQENPEIPVCVLSEGLSYTGGQELYQGLTEVLEAHQFQITLVEKQDSDTYRSVIEKTVYPELARTVLIALEPESLYEAADIISGSSVYQEHVEALYGIGSTVGILNEMDRGIIDGLMAYNQFDEGYLSVEKAVKAIAGERPESQEKLDFVYVKAEDLRKGTYEKMLYPME
ncbi:MAG TPA: sugar ABC transporter substrate-binding protein [Candidatus Copromonas faecavium]|uniref:Sugar ABC transporter substrate-binding protein n=1 Tax=Candidatus Copromonas faecavium (nom. illeg.) TaxID=2840740 RepID=A0A9D1A4J1_9FIRM|nr:sugar ABC transporter substrate-binding protein [Candidatus Copromonas faecavium]